MVTSLGWTGIYSYILHKLNNIFVFLQTFKDLFFAVCLDFPGRRHHETILSFIIPTRIKWREWKGGADRAGPSERKEEEEGAALKRGRTAVLPVCDSRLGDSRPGRPGCSSLGLSWIPAPEQRLGGRPGRELEGERRRERLLWHRIRSSATIRWIAMMTVYIHLISK